MSSEVKGGKEVRFVVTGFGPFANSKHNPTTAIATKLVDYLQKRGDPESQDLAACTKTIVIEVSLEAARQEMNNLHQEILASIQDESDEQKQTVIILHLGVNYRGNYFQLEQCAYNDADFRIPDERGHQPRKEPIVEGVPVGEPLVTQFDLPPVLKELNDMGSRGNNSTPAVISTDPGRFVCNYLYYTSLSKNSTTAVSDSVRVLFLHVPPNEVADDTEQLCFVADLMLALKRQVQCSVNPDSAPSLFERLSKLFSDLVW